MPRAYKRCDLKRVRRTGLLTSTKAISTAKMIKKLGKPTCTIERGETGMKTTKEWHVPIGKSVLTVYDYKGDRWSIGGKKKDRNKARNLRKLIES